MDLRNLCEKLKRSQDLAPNTSGRTISIQQLYSDQEIKYKDLKETVKLLEDDYKA